MPDDRRRRCRICLKRDEEVGPISWRGRCEKCGVERAEQAAIQLHEHRGPVFLHWRNRIAASVGAVLLDDPPAAVHTQE